MAGLVPAIGFVRRAPLPSCPGLTRASSLFPLQRLDCRVKPGNEEGWVDLSGAPRPISLDANKDVDGRDKPGHDVDQPSIRVTSIRVTASEARRARPQLAFLN